MFVHCVIDCVICGTSIVINELTRVKRLQYCLVKAFKDLLDRLFVFWHSESSHSLLVHDVLYIMQHHLHEKHVSNG